MRGRDWTLFFFFFSFYEINVIVSDEMENKSFRSPSNPRGKLFSSDYYFKRVKIKKKVLYKKKNVEYGINSVS